MISCTIAQYTRDFPGGSDSKASAYNAGDPGSIPGLMITSLNTGIQDGLHVPCCKYTMLPCLPLRPHGFITQMFRLFLNECIKDLKNGTCLFQVPVLWFIRNEREKNGSVKQKREGEACER